MKQTLRTFFSVFLFFCLLTTSEIEIKAKAEIQVTRLKAIISEPINIYISPFKEEAPSILKGQIKSPKKISTPIQSLSFSIVGKNEEILWKSSIPWKKKFKKNNGKIAINFEHNLKETPISGKNELLIKLIGIENQIVAIQSKEIPFPKRSEPPLSEIITVKTKENNDSIFIDIDFLNKGDATEFYAKTDVYKNALKTEKIEEIKTKNVSLEPSQTTTFSLNFPKPKNPNFYPTETQIFDSNGTPQSGIIQDGFLINGLFALVEFADISPKKFLSPGENAEIKVKGTVNVPPKIKTSTNDLSILISARTEEIDPKGEFEFFKDESFLEVDMYKNFSKTFFVPIEEPIAQVWTDIKIKRGEEILAEKSISSKKYINTDAGSNTNIFLKNTSFSPPKISQENKTKVIIGGAIAFLLLIISIIFIVKINKKKKNLSIFLIAFCFSTSVAEAETIIYPIFEYYRTVNLPTDEPFNEVAIRGRINGGTGILFRGEKYTTEITMTREKDEENIVVTGEILNVTNTNKFFFTFDAADVKLPNSAESEPLVIDSDYRITNITLTNMVSEDIIEIDLSLPFNITNEKPKSRFELKSTSGNDLLDPTGIDFNEIFKNCFHEGNPDHTICDGNEGYFIENPDTFAPNIIQRYFTKETIIAKIYCGTADSREGLGLNLDFDTDICSSDSPHLEEIEILGNFCDDPNICNVLGARLFKICNLTGNCSTTSGVTNINVRNFDTSGPVFGLAEISNGDTTVSNASDYKRTDSTPLAAIENYIFKVLNVHDAEEVDSSSFHINACGIPTGSEMTDYDDYFYEKTEGPNNLCHPKKIPCAISSYQRGIREYTRKEDDLWREIPEADLACAQQCEPNYPPTFCSPEDEIENGGDGIMRCCRMDLCHDDFPLCLPFNLQ